MSLFSKLKSFYIDKRCAPWERELKKLRLWGCMADVRCTDCKYLNYIPSDNPHHHICKNNYIVDKLDHICGTYWAQTKRGRKFWEWERKLFYERHPEYAEAQKNNKE